MTTLTDDDKQIVHYLRQCPADSLKRDAANLIERLALQISSNETPPNPVPQLPDSDRI